MQPYQLLSTTRYDLTLTSFTWNDDAGTPSAFFLLHYHFDRLLDAAAKHGCTRFPNDYPRFKATVQTALIGQDLKKAYRLRIVVSFTGSLDVTATPIERVFLGDPFSFEFDTGADVLQVTLDAQPVSPSLFTETKTTSREVYNEARARCGIPPITTPEGRSSDVLLYNTAGLVMESSIFNVAFLREGKWTTPAAETGCLPGVARRWLLEHHRIVEDETSSLRVQNIIDGEDILLFNGLQGCRLGRINITE